MYLAYTQEHIPNNDIAKKAVNLAQFPKKTALFCVFSEAFHDHQSILQKETRTFYSINFFVLNILLISFTWKIKWHIYTLYSLIKRLKKKDRKSQNATTPCGISFLQTLDKGPPNGQIWLIEALTRLVACEIILNLQNSLKFYQVALWKCSCATSIYNYNLGNRIWNF